MKRQKRNYIFLIIAAITLPFSIAVLYTTMEKMLFYGKAQAIIVSVATEERIGGTSDDQYYYTESEIKCRYNVSNLEYRKTFTIKADYSGQEGKNITILYNKKKPYESVLVSKTTKAFLYSTIFTVGCIYYIVFDIRKWIEIRKQENEKASQDSFSDVDMTQYEVKKRKQKIKNIILLIASMLLFLPLFPLAIPLIVYTAASVIDYKLCYQSISSV